MASSTNRSSLKMIEVRTEYILVILIFIHSIRFQLATKNFGGILMFLAMLTHLHVDRVSLIFLIFPILGFVCIF